MSALRAVWRVLAEIPGLVYVALFVVASFAAAIFAIYHHGVAVGESAVHRKTLADSVVTESIAHQLTIEQTNRAATGAHFAVRVSDSGRVARNRLRETVIPLVESLPAPVVKLIETDDQQIRRDSVTIAVYQKLETSFQAERATAAELDTLRQHQVALGTASSKGHNTVWFAGGFAVAVLLTFAVAASR